MLRQYGRLGIITATVAFFLIVLSLNLLQTSPGGQESALGRSVRQGESKSLEIKEDEGIIYHGPLLPPEGDTAKEDTKDEVDAAIIESTLGSTKTGSDGDAVEQEIAHDVKVAVEDSATHTTLMGNDFGLQKESTATTTTTSEAPVETKPTKVIVMGKMSYEDSDWVAQEMTEWQNAIYYVDLPPGMESPSGLRTKMNKAKEVTPYLTYIVDTYPDFPDVMAFIHPHRKGLPAAWHNDAPNYDAVNMLNMLRLDTVMDRGYVNLRCNNEIGCPDEVQPWRNPPDNNKHAEHAYPYIYAHFFNASFAEMKEQISVVATQCCAQFAVSRKQMLSKPKGEYERYLRFIEETHYSDATAGTVLEYMWHIIFGAPAVQCEDMFECWCNVYGRCRHMGMSGAFRGRPPHFGV